MHPIRIFVSSPQQEFLGRILSDNPHSPLQRYGLTS